MIYHFTPYSVEKNFGKVINQCCEIVPNLDDWICIRDGDAMNLTPDWGNIIEEAIDIYGQDYKLFGCWTNRLNKTSKQIVTRGMYDERDILCHHFFAEQMKNNQSGITDTNYIAGFFMLFQKRTWIQAGGFAESSKTFDIKFCKAVNGKIGLINRLYMYHLYRIWINGDPSTKHGHLL